jgi:secondary thiamine-phosphate synthase enzyme
MHILEPTVCRDATFQIPTLRSTEFVDITERIQTLVADAGIQTGCLNIQTLHTTTAIIVNEHEPLLLVDFAALLERAAPDDAFYRHDDVTVRRVNLVPEERANGHAHCRALLLGASVGLNIVGGRLQLGRWQRVFFVELDGPQTRELSVVVFGETGR